MAKNENTCIEMPSQEKLNAILRYEPETGKLFWKWREPVTKGDKIFNTKLAGKEAFTADCGHGYRQGRINYRLYYAHRIICAMVYGNFKGHVDHANGDRSDNTLANLRIVTRSQNQRNMSLPKHNTSGVIGVGRSRNKWMAQIKMHGKVTRLGTFLTIEEAAHARREAEIKFGFHENHGRLASKET